MKGTYLALRWAGWLSVGSLFLMTVIGCGPDTVEEPATSTTAISFPETRQGDVMDDYHGTQVADPYRWLEEIDSEETKAWIDAQNRVSAPYLEQLPAHDYFLERLNRLQSLPNPGPMRRQGGYWIERRDGPDGLELVVSEEVDGPSLFRVDENALGLADDEKLDGFRLAPGGERLAYTVSQGGSELLELRVLDLESGRHLDDRIPNLKYGMPYWTADGRGLVYWRYLNAGEENRLEVDRGSLVAFHRLGTTAAKDRVLLRDEPRDGEETGVVTWSQVSTDGRFIVLFRGTGSSVKLGLIDLGDPINPDWEAPARDLMDERDGNHVFAGNIGETLYFLTTRDAALGRVVATDASDSGNWRTVVPESEHLLEHVSVVGNHLVGAYRRDVKRALVVFAGDGRVVREIPLPAPGSSFWHGGAHDSPDLVFGFDAMAVPPRRMHHNVSTGRTRTLAAREVPGFEADDYVSRQVFYESYDGTRVPMFITHRKDIEPGVAAPTILYGYGSGGGVTGPIFQADFFAWMEAGGRVVLANVRGGGEYGEAWYEAGKLDKKQNTYDDFLAAAEYLIAEGHTSPDNLAVLGHSNGGMLVGAVMTQRPGLFAAAMPVVGVLDALRFPNTTAGARWAKGQGDARIPEQFPWVYAWSPLHNIEDGVCYPATLVMTAANDDLVHPAQSYKFAARLQAAQGCDRPAVLRVHESGGHQFYLENPVVSAEVLAFAARHTGLERQIPQVNEGGH